MREPFIHVGIIQEKPEISFTLLSTYKLKGKLIPPGDYSVERDGEKIVFNGETYTEITFESDQPHDDSFELKNVVIGVGFHWERKENQRFQGGLKVICGNEGLIAINIVSLEDYLKSVISSEMSATSSGELLKTHAVISRSWLLAQIQKNKEVRDDYHTSFVSATEIIRWYDREDHALFDVCADDHCQRYQGITRQTTARVNQSIDETRGQVITYGDAICDARFSKCCGGVTEAFENVWEPIPHPYLVGKPDYTENTPLPDLTFEENARAWILSTPPAFCNTTDADVLRQILNDYDRETADFYRWKVVYTQSELNTLIKERSGIDYGEIIALEPLERGSSGRIIRLKIIGTKRVMIIGKELEIRRTLSTSHLYSAAFVVDAEEENNEGIPQQFTLTGAGWGHGVGLCQIGAAMMAEKGYHHDQILIHYFPQTKLIRYY
ncbi:MAG: SpoIID/LytB domain-containing protein [Porphyromonadaceae bacterium]|nr:SpoIID/LytB domain-containing protein [Porphyromonadaceae bacterium]